MHHSLRFVALLLALLPTTLVLAQNPRVWLETDRGPIFLELNPDAAPITTENFLTYVNEGFYDGLVFQTPPDLGAFETRGTIVLSFDDCSNARFSYDLPDYGSGELELIRLTLPDRQPCDKYEPG